MKIRHEKENLNKAAIKIESYWPVDPVSDEVEKVLQMMWESRVKRVWTNSEKVFDYIPKGDE